jgi:hypothetical protein
MRKFLTSLLIVAALPASAFAAKPGAYNGRWILPCEDGNFCRIYIEKAKQRNHFKFNFMTTKPGNKPSDDCTWDVDMTYDKGAGQLIAVDPYNNYGFDVAVQKDGSLHTSGTMLPVCGPQPMERTFQKDGSDDYGDE